MTSNNNNPSKQDIEQARKNVEWAMLRWDNEDITFDSAVDRIMEMIIGAYKQGQQHNEGYCDFCNNKLPELACAGCGEPIHGTGANCEVHKIDGKEYWFHGGWMCKDLFREKKKN
jgi:hypothetical protein